MDATSVVEDRSAPPLLLRALWFIFVGLWLGGIVTAAASALNVTIIGLPLGLWIINRIPTVMTLRPMHRELAVDRRGDGRELIRVTDRPQASFLVRAIWFLLVGWWLGGVCLAIAWGASATFIGIPIAIWLYNRIPTVTTLARY